METGCPCCGRPVAAPWKLTIQPFRLYRGWRPDGHRQTTEHALCDTCSEWLGGMVATARGEGPGEAVFGSPNGGGRRLVFDDQCHVCCEMPTDRAARIAWVSPGGGKLEVFACAGCEAWIASLAADGRTVRGVADREVDGPYGSWPHPNLRGVSVRIVMEDRAARAVAVETCKRMAVNVVPGQADIVVVEATARGNAGRALRSGVRGERGTVVLAGLAARRDLAAALAAGASCWTTVPLTPQQLTAGLVGALRPQAARGWEQETCLPIADAASMDRPAVLFAPAVGADPFEVGWLLRRFARGYDTVEWLDGRIAVSPRVHPDHVAQVAERLRLLLAGRATAEISGVRELPRRGRFEAAG
jgi:hypothetical protein